MVDLVDINKINGFSIPMLEKKIYTSHTTIDQKINRPERQVVYDKMKILW